MFIKQAASVVSFKLAIIIINYKTPQMVIDCLVTLLPDLVGVNSQVVVVDNDSGDDSVAIMNAWIDQNDSEGQVVIVASKVNGGFSAGNNVGIKAVDAMSYLLLNSDTLIRKGAIATLINESQANPDYGLFSPRLEWPDAQSQKSCFKFHTPFSEMIDAACTGLITKLLRRYVVAQDVDDKNTSPQWTSFACVMIKKEVIDDVGLMDENFFMYYEDVAYCHRAKQMGWKVLNLPQAHVVHLRGGSSPVKQLSENKKRLPSYYYESRARYFYLVYGRLGLLAANLMWWCGRSVSWMRELVSSKQSHVNEKKWWDIWTNFWSPDKGHSNYE